jgi:hypothetical protein
MDRHRRAFQPAALPLEGRIPLATAIATTPAIETPRAAAGTVLFLGNSSSAGTTEQVVQQGDEATVWLQGPRGYGPLQVQVATDPSSPAVGVNLPAVNETVIIPGGLKLRGSRHDVASVTIPTNAGAPNPGEVDVNLTITAIDPPTGVNVQGGPLELRILAPDATTPPMIIGAAGTPDGIQLMFSKPMNPVQASNVLNYAVRETYTTTSGKDDFLGPVSELLPVSQPGGVRISTTTKSVPLRAANYDPADSTVTLIPKRKLNYSQLGSIFVTQGSPAKTPAALRDGSSPTQGLTDLEGNAINQGGKPGKFHVSVNSGYIPVSDAQVV